MKDIFKRICYLTLFSSFLAGCSVAGSNLSPEKMIENAMKEEGLSEYYAEAKVKVIENDDATVSFIKEWRSKTGEVRIESRDEDDQLTDVMVNNGVEFMTYNVAEQVAYSMESPEMMELNDISPKELAKKYLNLIIDTHEIDVKSEGEFLGRNVVKIIAKTKETNSLIGDLEVWIDEKSHFVLKVISQASDSTIEVSYTKLDEKPELTKDLFALELDDNVDVIELEDNLGEEEITLAEAKEIIGEHLLVFPEDLPMTLTKITKTELNMDKINRVEVNMDYEQDDLTILSLSVFPSPEGMDVETDMMPGEEVTEVRGLPGTFMDEDGFRNIFWMEEGLNFSILIFDPNIEITEVIELVNKMEFVGK